MNDNCIRARGWLAQWTDNELAPAQTEWMESHWRECETCRAQRDRFQLLSGRLEAFGEQVAPLRYAAVERARFLARIDAIERERPRRWVWIPAAAALLTAAITLGTLAPRTVSHGRRMVEPSTVIEGSGFVAVPYLPPMAAYERSSVVSMSIPVSSLLAEGFTVGADPTAVVQADVLLGEDGRIYAVRLPSNQSVQNFGK